MYNIIPLILILISISIIIIIVIRKFSVLASIDVDNMPLVKEAKFKELIISNRLKRNFFKHWSKLSRLSRPLAEGLGNFLRLLSNYLNNLKEKYQRVDTTEENIEQQMKKLFAEAEELKKQDDLSLAEKKYIEIIGLDSKNIKAFKELGKIYFEQKNYEEAKQTFEHVLKLKRDDDVYDNLAQIAREKGDLNQAKEEYLRSLEINRQNAQTYFNLALIYQAMGNLTETVKNIKNALKIEPNNPRYLDTMLEISIMIKDKITALDAFNRLIKVNPENQKIKEFKKQIDEL